MTKGHAERGERRAVGSAALAAIVVLVFVAGAASVFLIESGSVRPQSSTTLASSSSVTSTGVQSPASGLQLSLTVNSTTVSTGRGVSATIDEANTEAAPLNVSASKTWPIQGLAIGPCGTQNDPVGLAVLSGNYGLSNVSSAKALQIYKPGVYSCPATLSGISSYVFQASSENATVYGSCQPDANGCFSETVEASVSFSGYWNGTTFTSFPSGVYTVVAGDEWGGIAILHFVVT